MSEQRYRLEVIQHITVLIEMILDYTKVLIQMAIRLLAYRFYMTLALSVDIQNKTRRNLLKLTLLVAIPLAGCSGTNEGDGGTSPDTENPPQSSTSPTPEAGAPTETETPDEPETATPQNQSASVQIGEKVAGDQMTMVVKSLSKTDSIGEFQQAESGNTYAVVRLEVKNTTQNKYADFSSFLQTKLKDDSGYTYTPSLSVSDSAFQGGQLAPGEVSRGDVVFEIPKNASGLTLQFDFSVFSFSQFDRVTVNLSSEADQIADLEQTLRVPVHDVGETVTHDGIGVTVNSVSFKESMGEFTLAAKGKEYAIVDVTTANKTESIVNFSSLLQMAMKDGTGQSFSYSAAESGQLTQSYSGGEVSAGKKIRGKVAFEVPKNTSPLYFTFEYSVISGGSKTFWKLR